jgi:hypothetical protein
MVSLVIFALEGKMTDERIKDIHLHSRFFIGLPVGAVGILIGIAWNAYIVQLRKKTALRLAASLNGAGCSTIRIVLQ